MAVEAAQVVDVVADARAAREAGPPSAAAELWRWLKAELAPTPGRATATVRIVCACLIVVTISMMYQLPLAAFSAFFVYFGSKEDMATTTLTGILLIFAATVAFAFTIFAFSLTVNHPGLRLAFMAAFFCGGMYLSRVFVVGPLAFAIAFILLISQQYVDLFPDGESMVRYNLWAWLAICIPACVTVLVQRLIAPARPNALLREEAKRRLVFVLHALDQRLSGRRVDVRAPFEAGLIGRGGMLNLLKLAAGSAPDLKSRLPLYTCAIDRVNRLVELACMLGASDPEPLSDRERGRLQAVRLACARLIDALDRDRLVLHAPRGQGGAVDAGAGPTAVMLQEMERYLAQIATALDGLADPAPPKALEKKGAHRLLVQDAFRNPVYLQYAVKVTAAAMLCYILYSLVDWNGIHTCVITCAVVALTSAGATIHKATLRIVGALIGGGLAIAADVYVVPHLESIGGLLLLITPVAAVSAWVLSGSERISYCGLQIAFAFFLCILHGYGPSFDSTDIPVIRDRLVGIVLGISVMAVFFRTIWPESAAAQMRESLAKSLRAGSELLATRRAATPDAAVGGAGSADADERAAVFENLATAGRLSEFVVFEPPTSEANASASVTGLLANAQAVGIAAVQLADVRQSDLALADGSGKRISRACDKAAAFVLRKMADTLDGPTEEHIAAAHRSGARVLRFVHRYEPGMVAHMPQILVLSYQNLFNRVERLSRDADLMPALKAG